MTNPASPTAEMNTKPQPMPVCASSSSPVSSGSGEAVGSLVPSSAVAVGVSVGPASLSEVGVAVVMATVVEAASSVASFVDVLNGVSVGRGVDVEEASGIGLDVRSAVGLVGAIAAIRASVSAFVSAPGLKMSTNPIINSPMKQNPSRTIKGIANLRLVNNERKFPVISFLFESFDALAPERKPLSIRGYRINSRLVRAMNADSSLFSLTSATRSRSPDSTVCGNGGRSVMVPIVPKWGARRIRTCIPISSG